MTALENIVQSGEGPALHRHLKEDEFYITQDAARILVMFAPAGMESFFGGHAGLGDNPTPQDYRQLAHDAGMEVLGPPMAAPVRDD